MKLTKIPFIIVTLLTLGVFSLSCSQLQQNTSGFDGPQQQLVDVYPDPFGSRVFEATDYQIEMDVVDNQVINWMAIDQSGSDLGNFAIVSYSFNGRTKSLPAVSPSTIVESFIIRPPIFGAPNVNRNKLLVTVRYSPSNAIESVNKPHQVRLDINHDGGRGGIVTTRYHLEGYTTGILPGKCNRSPDSMEVFEYEFVNAEFDMYLCSASASLDAKGLVNTDRGGNISNVASVPIEGNLVFYKPDDESICIFGRDGDLEPSFPDFALPLPRGFSAETDSLGALSTFIPFGSRAECSLDADGNFLCDQNIELNIFNNQVPVLPLSLSNLTQTPSSAVCPTFGEAPSPDYENGYDASPLGSDEIILVGFTEILPNANTQTFSIDGALVVAIIKARLVQ